MSFDDLSKVPAIFDDITDNIRKKPKKTSDIIRQTTVKDYNRIHICARQRHDNHWLVRGEGMCRQNRRECLNPLRP